MEKYSPEWKDLAPRDVVARAIHTEMEAPRLFLRAAGYRLAHARRRDQGTFPQYLCQVPASRASTSPASRSRSSRRRTTSAAAWRWTNGARPVSTICTPWARSPAPGCTAPTAWPPPPCWRDWSGAIAPLGISKGFRLEPRIQPSRTSGDDVPAWDESGLTQDSDPALIQGDMQTIQNIMWHYVGLIRSGDRLSRAIRELRHLQNEIETFYRRHQAERRADRPAQRGGGGADHRPGRAPQPPEPRLPLPARTVETGDRLL